MGRRYGWKRGCTVGDEEIDPDKLFWGEWQIERRGGR